MGHETRIDEIAPQVYRLATFAPGVAGAGLTFNQFLIRADEPMLVHTGSRALFPQVRAAAQRVLGAAPLRWIGCSHHEADESGALGHWLAAEPRATAVHTRVGCATWLADECPPDRAPRALADGAVVDLGGGRRARLFATPHLPHGWDACLWFEEHTRTLFCSDLLAQRGDTPALAAGSVVEEALALEAALRSTAVTPTAGAQLRRLAALEPQLLAIMHGASVRSSAAASLHALGAYLDAQLAEPRVPA